MEFLEQAGGTAVGSVFAACSALKGCCEPLSMSAAQKKKSKQAQDFAVLESLCQCV